MFGKDWSMINTEQVWIEETLHIVQIIFYSIGSYAACFGLNRWKDEVSYKARYELAKSLLNQTYIIRDTIRRTLNTVVFPYEYPNKNNEEAINDYERDRYVYSNRLEKLKEDTIKYYSIKLEAEAIYQREKQVIKYIQSLIDLINDLQNYLITEVFITPSSYKDRTTFKHLLESQKNETENKLEEIIHNLERYFKSEIAGRR